MGWGIFFWLTASIVVAVVASNRGRSGVGWFFLAVLISPLLAFAAVVGMQPRRAPGQMKKCPRCAEMVQAEATVCRFCGYVFSTSLRPGRIQENYRGVLYRTFSDGRIEASPEGTPRIWANLTEFRAWVDGTDLR